MKRAASTRARRLFALVSLAGLVTSVLPGTAAADDGQVCRQVQVPVGLTDGGPKDQTLWGELCAAGDPAGKPVQILVHGFALSHLYWDFPYGGARYSYVDAAVSAGYATLSIDRIGVGASSKPPGTAVTIDSNAAALHDLVTAVRSGAVTGSGAAKVLLVGHSLGTAIAWTEAGRYRDVDGLIATGFLHTLGVGGVALLASARPVELDETYAEQSLPVGYLTTAPGSRWQFYDPANTDPAVVTTDERTKGTGTVGEVATVAAAISPTSEARNVDVPVLLAVGGHDLYFCMPAPSLLCPDGEALVARERAFFGAGARLSGYVLPGAGHNAALELNAADLTRAMLTWAARVAPAS